MTDAELLQRYQDLGLRLVYWERIGTEPRAWKGPQDKGWNDPARAYPLEKFDAKRMNLGVITGCEIAPGRFLADVDLDWTPGIELAARLLPSTGFAFGRKGKKISHAIFTTPSRLATIRYTDYADETKGTGDGDTFVELRSGNFSHQTMIAPSLHSPGVHIELVLAHTILHVENATLERSSLDYAIGCLVLKRVPGGLHHDGRKALAGFLLRAGFSTERVTLIGEEICRIQASRGVPDMSSRDVSDMALVVRSTAKQIESGKKISGGPTLAEFIGGDTGKFVLARLNKWLGRDDDFVRDANGRILAKHQGNIARAVRLFSDDLSYNEFSAKPLLNGRPLEDFEVNRVLLRIETEFRFQPPQTYFEMVMLDLARQRSFHPVKDYLRSVSWDGVPRLDRWIVTAADAEDTPYVRAISSILLIAAVRRIMHPGCKYDEMVVWESSQGLEKSSAARALCPNPEWFSDDLPLNVDSKQVIERTLGKWVVEASDLAGKRKTEIEHLKAMLSRQVDGPARLAYAHFPVERPRHFILIGTTNSPAYLNDPSGARRFWPMKVKRFDLDWIVQLRDQLWAEAVVREAAGESIRLVESLWPEAARQQEKRREIDPWEDLLRGLLLSVPPSGDGRRRIATSQLWTALNIPSDRRDRSASLRISEVLHRLGFKRTTVRINDEAQVGYVTEHPENLLRDVAEVNEEDRVLSEADDRDIPI